MQRQLLRRAATAAQGRAVLPNSLRAAWCSSGSAAQQQALQPQQEHHLQQDGGATSSLAAPRRKRARPLEFTERFVLYRASVDIQEVADTARRKCQLGAALGASGFAALVVTAAAAAPAPALGVLLGGAAANSYALAVIAQRLIRKLAARHVERLVILPVHEGSVAGAKKAPAPEDEDEERGGVASILFTAATVEERLQATPELRLEVRTGSTDRWFSLVDPPEPEFHGSFASELGEGAAPGSEESMQPACLADLCSRISLLHVDLDDGTCYDQALLDALLAAPKALADEHAAARLDAGPALALAADAPPPGPMLSEMTRGDVEEVARTSGSGKEAPAKAIKRIGQRALVGGASVLGAGVLFVAGEGARDPDGVARWKNLNLAI